MQLSPAYSTIQNPGERRWFARRHPLRGVATAAEGATAPSPENTGWMRSVMEGGQRHKNEIPEWSKGG